MRTEIITVLLFKLVVLLVLKLVFFSDPPAVTPGYGLERYLTDTPAPALPSERGEDP